MAVSDWLSLASNLRRNPLGALAKLWRKPLPTTRGTLDVGGLRAPIEVLRDAFGVPHLYARDLEDLVFAQGFVHAQDRFWQMELTGG